MTSYRCPLCGTKLTRERYEKVLGVWQERRKSLQEFEERLRKDRGEFEGERRAWRAQQRRRIRQAIQQGKEKEIGRAKRLSRQLDGALVAIQEKERQIKDLKEQLKRGTSPQVEGLLDEIRFARVLQEAFPQDKIEHTGKGGDVLQHVRLSGRPIDSIVYECKRVPKVLPAHVAQTRRALLERKASHGVLVTGGTKAGRFGFWSEKGVFVVHPLGAISLAGVLRDSLVALARMQLTRREREVAAKQIFDFLCGPEFKNNMQDVLQRAVDLRDMLQKEATTHFGIWKRRYDHYRSIYERTSKVRSRLLQILETRKQLPRPLKALPPPERWAQFSLPL